MTESFTLPKREDNSTEDAEKLAKWARAFDDVEANIVMDYIQIGSPEYGNVQMIPGGLNGVTVQWDIWWDPSYVGQGEGELQRVAAQAVHVRPGQTIARTADGFEVSE